MKDQIEAALTGLIGKALWGAGRAGDVIWLHFGEQETVVTWRDTIKEVGEYALHLQCAWRITSTLGIHVGSQDIHYPAGKPLREEDFDVDLDQPGANRCDEKLSSLFKDQGELLVDGISADSLGGFRLLLSNGVTLEAFPDNSREGEFWRLFQPSKGIRHFVVTGGGIE